jgi:16S rRNA (cytosine1402-N4)-methyltransferase
VGCKNPEEREQQTLLHEIRGSVTLAEPSEACRSDCPLPYPLVAPTGLLEFFVSYHQPVLLQEVLQLFAPLEGKIFCDGTLGGGGHTRALLAAGAAQVIGVDRDPEALAYTKAHIGPVQDRLKIVQSNFQEIPSVIGAPLDGLLLDLGVSSAQLDQPERGFSFRAAGPLDMRMGPDAPRSLQEFLAESSEEEIANAIYQFGEEHKSRAVARALFRAQQEQSLNTTKDIADIVRRVVGYKGHDRIDPATRTFQGLRIAINQELEALESLLRALPTVLALDGVAVIISYHSLEDRLVKHTFRQLSLRCTCPKQLPICACGGIAKFELLTKHPVEASEAELEVNPRSRSAKLRAIRRLI